MGESAEHTAAQGRRWTAWVAGLYVAQGLPFGVIQDMVPVWLRVHGTSLEQVGLVSLVGLPWTIKFLWAPLVDGWQTPKFWIRGALGLIAVGVCALPWIAEIQGFGAWVWGTLLALAFASATQDIAIDGYTTVGAPAALHGRVNGIRIGAYRAAMLLGGGATVALAPTLGWKVMFGMVALLAAVLALGAARLPSVSLSAPSANRWWADLRDWLASDGWRNAIGFLCFVLLFKLGDAAMGPMVRPFWLDSGRSLEEVGFVTTVLGMAFTVVGGIVGGELVVRWGMFRALWVLGALQALSNVGYAAAALSPSPSVLVMASAVESFCGGLGTAAFLAFLMRACGGRQGATRFALLSSLSGLTRTLAGAASGFGAARLGYPVFFLFTALLAVPAFFLLPAARRRMDAAPTEGTVSA